MKYWTKQQIRKRCSIGLRSGVIAAGIMSAAVLISACGGSSSSGGSSSGDGAAAKSVSAVAPKTGCGSYAAPKPKDPDGLVAALPAKSRALYNGYPFTVSKSAWSNWKPKHGPPYKVGIQWAQLVNDFQVNITKTLKAELAANPDIGEVKFQSTGDNLDVGAQLQQLQSLIRGKPDIIILEELQPNAFVDAIELAGKAGIPVIVAIDSIPSKYAVNVQYNLFDAPAQAASIMARQIGGKGNLLMAHGIPGVGVDVHAFNGFNAVLKNCPDLKKAGEIYGGFVPSSAKSETLKFLATHPQKIDGVMQTAGMTSGIIDAFESNGRPVPSVADVSANKSSLAYWRDNFDSYRGAGAVVPTLSIGKSLAGVAGRMLDGDGVTMSDIVGGFPLVTDSNLDKWVQKDWTVDTPGDPLGGPDDFLSAADLDQFFKSGSGK